MGEAKTKTNHTISPKKALIVSLVLALLLGTGYVLSQAGQSVLGCSGVNLYPNSNIQRAIDRASRGTTFCLQSGNYRLSEALTPKDGQRFIGKVNTYMYGSIILDATEAEEVEPNVWQWSVDYPGNTKICQDDTGENLFQNAVDCYPEELFIGDNKPLKHVSAGKPLLPGTWSYNYLEDTVMVYNSAADAQVELSIAPAAFTGDATDVTLENFHISRFANPTNSGAVGGITTPENWTLNNVALTKNHGYGAVLGEGAMLHHVLITDNGQGGVWLNDGSKQSNVSKSKILNNVRLSAKNSTNVGEVVINANNVVIEDTLLLGTKNALIADEITGLSVINSRIDTANVALNQVDGAQFSNSSWLFTNVAVNGGGNLEFINNVFGSTTLLFDNLDNNANTTVRGNSFNFGEEPLLTGTKNTDNPVTTSALSYSNNSYQSNDDSVWLWNGKELSLAEWQEIHGATEESVDSILVPGMNFYNRLPVGPQN